MKLNVGEIRGLLANSYNITVPSDSAISFATGAQLTHSTLSTSHMVVPYGTTTEWDNQVRVHQKDFLIRLFMLIFFLESIMIFFILLIILELLVRNILL